MSDYHQERRKIRNWLILGALVWGLGVTLLIHMTSPKFASHVMVALACGLGLWNIFRFRRFPRLCAEGSPKVVRRALDEGHEVNAQDGKGWTALHWAALSNPDPDVVRTLVQAGANVHARDRCGLTPLMLAAYHNATVIPALLEAGAEVDARLAASGITPLMLVSAGRPEPAVVRAMLAASASVKARDENGVTPLMAAVLGDAPNPEVIGLLLAAGADARVRDNEGHDALWHARARLADKKSLLTLHILKVIRRRAALAEIVRLLEAACGGDMSNVA